MKSNIKSWCLACSALACFAMSATSFAETPLEPVPNLDIERYAGRWYEIAKYPNFFQRQCASDVEANYTRRNDGMIDVVNQCRKENGDIEVARGVARPDVMPPPLPSKLQVRFAPAWLSWLPFVWGRYWVVVLDPDYRYSVVSEPSRKYLWILSRTATMDEATYQSLLTRIRELGLDPSKLVRTPQTPA